MKSLMKTGFVMVGVILASCATLNEQQCKIGNWEEIGRQDGLRGLSAGRITSHSKACKEYGVQVNNSQYQNGYNAGVRAFCTPENGFQMGKSGVTNSQATCPADLAPAFSAAIVKGFGEFQRELAAREAERKTRELAAAKTAFYSVNPRAGICDASESVGVCFAFTGENFLKPEVVRGNQAACRFFNGQYYPIGNCPEPKSLGRCDLVKGTPDSYHLYYYQNKNVDQAAATKDCADPKSSLHSQGAGQWVGVPG